MSYKNYLMKLNDLCGLIDSSLKESKECLNLIENDQGYIHDILHENDIIDIDISDYYKQFLVNCDRAIYQKNIQPKITEPMLINKQYMDAIIRDSKYIILDFTNCWNGKEWNIMRDNINDTMHLLNLIKNLSKRDSYFTGMRFATRSINVTFNKKLQINTHIKNQLKKH
jgi:hypothetical protein